MAQQWPPKRATAFTFVFPIRDSSGNPVTGVAGLDSEVSKDGGAIADCTNEATEIGTTGFYSLTLTTTEMTADYVAGQIKSTSYPAVGFFICTTESTWDEGIDSKAVLSGAIAASSFATGAIDAAAIAADAITAAKIADGAIDAATFAANAITAAKLDPDVATELNAAVLAILGTPAGASMSADIAAIEAQTDDIGAAGAGLSAVPWNAAWDAEVQSEVDDALVVHRLDELLNADSDIDGAAPPTVGSVFHELMSKTAGSFTYDQTTDALEALRDNLALASALATAQTSIDDLPTNAELATALAAADDAVLVAIAALNNLSQANIRTAVGLASANLDTQLDALPTAAENADAVWDEDATAHQTTGTFGQAIGDPAANSETLYKAIVTDPAGTNIAADVIALKAETAAILADTDVIGATGGGLTSLATAAALATAQTSIDDLPTNAELATSQAAADDATLAAITTAQTAIIDGILDGIKLSKNTAFSAFPFKMVDSTDHVTAETGITVTATRSIDGAAFGACANSASEIASGWYKIDLAAGDLNGDVIILRFTGTGCDAREFVIITQPKD